MPISRTNTLRVHVIRQPSTNVQIIANGNAKEMTELSSREAFAEIVQRELPGASVTFTDAETDIVELVKRVVAEGATMVVAGGGDGTVNAVASVVIDTEIVLGVLPLGTLNHFAKDIGTPLALEDAVRALANGRVEKIDVGQVNDRIFVNNSGLGLYPDMVSNREEAQKKGLSKWPAAIAESVRAFARYRLLTIRVKLDSRAIERKTPAVFIGNNEYTTEGTFAVHRLSLCEGQLALYIPHVTVRLKLVWFVVRALFGIPRSNADFDKILASTFVIESRHAQLHVSLDGEVVDMRTPLTYLSRPKSLSVMIPSGQDA
jgi:YegS/Rv2252/BmrU family lipid kinase